MKTTKIKISLDWILIHVTESYEIVGDRVNIYIDSWQECKWYLIGQALTVNHISFIYDEFLVIEKEMQITVFSFKTELIKDLAPKFYMEITSVDLFEDTSDEEFESQEQPEELLSKEKKDELMLAYYENNNPEIDDSGEWNYDSKFGYYRNPERLKG
jgi:hypothetical protein